MARTLCVLLTMVGSTLFAGPSWATGGQLEINQTCAVETGCFSGDGPGFPVTITQAGSYVLTSNLAIPDANTTAIEIGSSVDRSSIDLGGFRIEGVTVCSVLAPCMPIGTGVGIRAALQTSGVRVRNGLIFGMGSHGIQLQNRDYVKEVVAISNGGNGIEVGPRSSVIDCQAITNGGSGIKIDEITSGSFANAGESLLQGNLAVRNGLVDGAALDIQGSRATGGNVCSDGSCSSRGARRFYLTNSAVSGDQALQACQRGFHMASLWEVYDPSGLEYVTAGVEAFMDSSPIDTGDGPPSSYFGWIRTGNPSGGGFGRYDCSVWTSGLPDPIQGTVVRLSDFWNEAAPPPLGGVRFGPWEAGISACNQPQQVWCVED